MEKTLFIWIYQRKQLKNVIQRYDYFDSLIHVSIEIRKY
ncbi:hypothetical protein AQPE_4099 [Aquipluma nitroreducens]|uniref:Uncharacterized protein n=1 Tax=Aquipluma nitroreducens TaxID=2010828 RepID=A0A5K7SE91_9BACT|nr:hypothetical protein AQPE_4099 [Aquipluma nitroreducens]